MPPIDRVPEPTGDRPGADVASATRAAVGHVDAALAVVAAVTERRRERMVTGPSRPTEPGVEGLWGAARARVQVLEGGDGEAAVADVVACWRDRGLDVDDPAPRDGRLVADGRDGDGAVYAVDWNPEVRWFAVTARTAALPLPADAASHLDLDEVFLDRVDPDGERYRDLG